MLLALALVLAAALALLCLVVLRVSRNVGPLTLEEFGRREQVVFIPLSAKLVDELGSWSKPLRMRVERTADPLIGTMIFTTELTGAPGE